MTTTDEVALLATRVGEEFVAVRSDIAAVTALPEIYWNDGTSSWPSRASSIPGGYTGKVKWISLGYPDATAPSDAEDLDYWWGTAEPA